MPLVGGLGRLGPGDEYSVGGCGFAAGSKLVWAVICLSLAIVDVASVA